MKGETPYYESEQLMTALRHSDVLAAHSEHSDVPAPINQPATLIETHLNWVLLAEGSAWKIKKPVDFGFVNFRTLELRRRACFDELRLNKRLAPEIYQEVIPIYGSCKKPVLEPSGAPIEYVLRMKEFPQSAMLANQFASNRIEDSHIERFAGTLATFHERIPRAAADSPWGTPDEVIRPIHDILGRLERLTAEEDQCAIRLIHSWIDDEFSLRRALIQERRAQGFVRECHGDLHLGNLMLDNNEIVPFDCIEFSEPLRWIDVASEVAFLLMDLEEHRQIAAARLFLNQYLEATGDYGLLACLDLYVVYRAIVRATVTRLQIQISPHTPAQRSALMGNVASYIREAGQHLRRRNPRLWITHGCSGSGKSTGARELVRRVGAIQIRSDVERKRLTQGMSGLRSSTMALDSGRTPSLYSSEMNRTTYERLKSAARDALRAGFPVVVDATFLKRARRLEFGRLAAEFNVPFGILDFRAPPEVLRQRIRIRLEEGTDPSEATIHVLEQQLMSQEPLDSCEETAMIAIDDVLAD